MYLYINFKLIILLSFLIKTLNNNLKIMAQYKAFQEGVEVNGQTILSVITALPSGEEARMKILKKHGIDPEPDKWYSQQSWLDAFKEISSVIGEHTLFMIGKCIPENAMFPPEINDLKTALHAVDQAYKLNHRGGEIGNYTLTEFDEKNKSAVMVCNNPYPSEFDRGIITAMVRKFRPKGSFKSDVILDPLKESRTKGGNSSTYKIYW